MMKTKKRSFSLILAVLMLLALAMTASAAPVQNASGFYELGTAEDMLWFHDQVASGDVTINAVLTSNIDLTGVAWSPICYSDGADKTNIASEDRAYQGTFDGNGKKLSMVFSQAGYLLFESPDDGSDSYIGGLFVRLGQNAVVKNLSITGSEGYAQDNSFFFGTVAYYNYGTIYNCKVENFLFSLNAFYAHIGGLVGRNQGTIDSCTAQSNTVVAVGGAGGNYYFGMIVGSNGGFGSAGIIKNCISNGCSVSAGNSGKSIGGIVGVNWEGDILNCHVSAFRAASVVAGVDELGGIAARSREGTISQCTVSDSTLQASNATLRIYLSGIAAVDDANAVIENCTVSGTEFNGSAASNMTNYFSMGGISAVLSSTTYTVQNCLSENNTFTGFYDTDTAAGLQKMIVAGGIVGFTSRGGLSQEYTLTNCVARANTFDVTAQTNAIAYVGGIFGYIIAGGASDDYSSNVLDGSTFVISSDTAENYIGGFAGVSRSVIEDSVMTGFTYTEEGTGTFYAGSLCGYLWGTAALEAQVNDSLYNQDVLAGVKIGRTNLGSETNNIAFTSATLPEDLSADVLIFLPAELQLTVGESADLALSIYAGTKGITAYNWSTSDSDVVEIVSELNGSAEIKALALGSATVSCVVTINGVDETFSVAVSVPDAPEYAKDDVVPSFTGDPADGVIYLGETVNLTYDFAPYTVIDVNPDGPLGASGLSVTKTADGKVLLTGTATQSGTFTYVVTLLGADGVTTRTQTMTVTVQGGSRPTGGGGGSSNCNSGVGAAMFALLGLAFVYKRK